MLADLPKREKVVPRSVGLMEWVWDALDSVVEREGVKSRNAVIGGYLEFCLAFFPVIKSERRIREIAAAEGKPVPQMTAELVELGRAAYEKERRGRK
jgi:hypothetical protein